MRICLNGRVTLELGDHVIDEADLPGRQGRLLFAYLVRAHGRLVPRDELADALWGDTPPATSEKALTVLVSKLRRLLPEPEMLTSAFGCYRLELPDGTTVDIFEAAHAADDARQALSTDEFDRARREGERAVSLLRQPFLPGEDGAWVDAQRRLLAEIGEQALAAVSEACLRTGDAPAATRAAEQLIQLAPLRESGYRLLMEALVLAGNRAEALGAYERCRQTLADELGTYPSPETEAVYRTLLELPAAEPDEPAAQETPEPPEPTKDLQRRRRRPVGLALAAGFVSVAIVALVVLALGGDDDAVAKPIVSPRCSAPTYSGDGSPQLIVAVDLPLQPALQETIQPMVDAIRLAVERRGYLAGTHRVGLQFCDEEPATSDGPFEANCAENAQLYVEHASVAGVVGPLSSGCAARQIPILNKAPGAPVALVSPTATYVGLTRPVTDPVEPDAYYPTGERNFARVVPADDVQGAASAVVARNLDLKRVYVVDQDDLPSIQFANYFVKAARTLGIEIAGRGSWDRRAESSPRLADDIAKTAPDGVFLAVPSFPSSVELLKALRARLGPESQLMAPDSFDPRTALLAGAAAEKMTFTTPGPSMDDLGSGGDEFVAAFEKAYAKSPTNFALASAQAADLLFDAIASSDGSRDSVTRSLFKTRVTDGILGDFWITPTGDTTLNAVAVSRIVDGEITTYDTIVVPDALVMSP